MLQRVSRAIGEKPIVALLLATGYTIVRNYMAPFACDQAPEGTERVRKLTCTQSSISRRVSPCALATSSDVHVWKMIPF